MTAFRSPAERRIYPYDQNVERKAAAIPMAVAKNVTGEEIFPVTTLENERMTADTIVNTSCNQNPKLPRLLKDLEVFSNFLTTYTIITNP